MLGWSRLICPDHLLLFHIAFSLGLKFRKIWLVKLLNPEEVSRKFQKKWRACVHWVAAGNGDIRIPMYSKNACHGLHVVKVHSLMRSWGWLWHWGSNRALTWLHQHYYNSNLLWATKLNMVAPMQGEPLRVLSLTLVWLLKMLDALP